MSSNADISRGRGFADAATGAAAGSGPSQGSGSQGLGSSPTRGVRDRQVIYYVLLSLAALLPGLAGWFYGIVGEGTVVGTWHGWLLNELQDIKFGSGFRFWLGVTGASMMGVMLLYPLRKLLVQRVRSGSVGGWFHIHIILGLLGPVMILYHCNFGFGAFNANVALVTMLAVVISGIVGQFVYQRVSAGFYGDKLQARGHLDAVIGQLRAAQGIDDHKEALIGRLEAFEAQLLTPRRGVIASILGSLRVEVRRRQFFRDAGGVLAELRHANGWSADQHQHMRQLISGHLGAYVSTARRAAGRSIREQLWARWRLFHLPLFLIMTVAAVLHVAAVWDMDGPVGNGAATDLPLEAAAAADVPSATPAAAPAKRQTSPIIQQQVRKTVRIESAGGATANGTEFAGNPTTTVPEKPQLTARGTLPPAKEPDAFAAIIAADERQEPEPRPELAAEPKPALMDRPKPATRTVATAKKPDDAYKPPAVAQAEPTLAPATAAANAAATKGKPSSPAPADQRVADAKPADPLYAELAKRTEGQPMGLGVAKGGTLAERIASLKATRFDHNKTHFPLTGKHSKAACEDCHTKTLENTPTACIACHKKDDAHRGRRPDCARCHTPNNWDPIRRR